MKYACGNEPRIGDIVERTRRHSLQKPQGVVELIWKGRVLLAGETMLLKPHHFRLIRRSV